MSKDIWQGDNDNWETKTDWSDGLPVSTSSVVIDLGDPLVTAPFSVAQILDSATLTFTDAGTADITGLFDNSGALDLDTAGGGGTNLTIGGVFRNSGTADIGSNYASNVDDDTLTVGSIDNAGGYLTLDSALSGPQRAALVVEGAASFAPAPGTVTGGILLVNDSLVEFEGGGQITTIAKGGSLTLYGKGAHVADTGELDSNSALQGLTSIDGAYAGLALDNGAEVTTDGPLTVHAGQILFDFYGSQGGSTLDVGGMLTNHDDIYMGNSGITQDDVLEASSLDNVTGAVLSIQGSTSGAEGEVLLTGVAQLGAAAGWLDGDVDLAGDALIAFDAGGQIATIAKGGELSLSGQESFIADSTDETSNSALQGLASVAGSLLLEDSDVTTTTGMNVAGKVEVDAAGLGGSTLAVGLGLVIDASGKLDIGNASLADGASVVATGLSNAGTITLQGGAVDATLRVGRLSNSGTIKVDGDSSLTIAGASTGTGTIQLSGGGVVELTGGGSDDDIDFTGAGEAIVEYDNHILNNPVTGFALNDSIEFNTTWVSKDQVVYIPNIGANGGTVEVETALGVEVAAFQVVGDYSKNNFKLGQSGKGDLLLVSYQSA